MPWRRNVWKPGQSSDRLCKFYKRRNTTFVGVCIPNHCGRCVDDPLFDYCIPPRRSVRFARAETASSIDLIKINAYTRIITHFGCAYFIKYHLAAAAAKSDAKSTEMLLRQSTSVYRCNWRTQCVNTREYKTVSNERYCKMYNARRSEYYRVCIGESAKQYKV